MAVAEQAHRKMQSGGFERVDVASRPVEPPRVPAETWRKVCRFQPVSQGQTLDMVLQAVEVAMDRYKRRGRDKSIKRPLVVLDLDDTLFKSNQSRTWRILREWLAERPSLPRDVRRPLAALAPEALAYRLVDTFTQVAGLDLGKPHVKVAFADFDAYWNQRFFSNAYCQDDALQAGAVAYAKKLEALEANIAYLTGRDAPRMGKGTRKAIATSGLPRLSRRVKVFLKPNKDMDDAVFKKSVRGKLSAWGHVIATFDNAPANCVVLKDAFPQALNVFVDTVFDPGPVSIRHGLFKISDFRRLR